MATKDELVEQAKAQGIDPDGLTKAQLEEALKEAESESGDTGDGSYYPQQRRHEAEA